MLLRVLFDYSGALSWILSNLFVTRRRSCLFVAPCFLQVLAARQRVNPLIPSDYSNTGGGDLAKWLLLSSKAFVLLIVTAFWSYRLQLFILI